MLYQFHSNGTVSLLAHIERAARRLPTTKSCIHAGGERSNMDAWVAQDYWRVSNQNNAGRAV